MSTGKYPINSSGREPVNASGRIYRATTDDAAICCCGPACPNCDIAPTAFDVDFASITTCPTHAAPEHTFHATGPTMDPSHTPPLYCEWIETLTAAGVDLRIDATTVSIGLKEAFLGGLLYFDINPAIAYGTDCSATILAANTQTNCIGKAGHGGNVSAAPVMPP